MRLRWVRALAVILLAAPGAACARSAAQRPRGLRQAKRGRRPDDVHGDPGLHG
ncbi:MAG: hypothetical protein HYS71_04885 [Candidatus Omnitrophica bacterium]|nr:hypothetical protein [Candidatus Omnitrophota bacterium]